MVGIIALLGTALAAPTCPQGQEVVHRKGHCCWPGQSWSWSKKQCSGMPRQCPDGWSVVRPPPGSTQPATCQDLKTLDGVFGSSDRAGVLGALRDEGEGGLGAMFDPNAPPRTTDRQTPLTDHLSFHDPIILGALDKVFVDGVLIEHSSALGRCAKPAAAAGMQGTVEMKFVIAKTGQVTKASVKADSLGHPDAGRCFEKVLMGLQFPPPSGGGIVIASYPFAVGG